jgi:MFS family permease
MSARKQRIVLWWSLGLLAICGFGFGVLMHMIPPPHASWSAGRVARFYRENRTSIRIGATVAGWTSGFMIPFSVVVAAQIARQEEGRKIWAALALVSGAVTSIFIAIPPLAWGAAAFAPERAPQITAMMHQFGTLTYITTDQLYIGMWVAVVVACFTTPANVKHSPFPRWWGYASAWIILMFEFGAFAFIPHTGPLSWRGVLVFWFPIILFGSWLLIQAYLILRALKGQQREEEAELAGRRRPADIAHATPARA